MKARLKNLSETIENVLSAGLGPQTDPELLWRVRTVMGASLLFLVIQIAWIFVTSLYFRVPIISFLFLGLSAVTVGLLFTVRRKPTSVKVVGHILLGVAFTSISVPNYLTGGTAGANLTTQLIIPFAAVLVVGWQAIFWIILSGGLTIAWFIMAAQGVEFPDVVPEESRSMDALVTLVLAWVTVSSLLLYYERARRLTAREARRQREAALAAAEAKSAFLANVSHEIRTPLGGIFGMNRLMLETPLDEEQLEYQNSIKNCANSLLEVVDDVLDLSKLEAGRLELEDAPFALHSAAEEVCSSVAVRAHEKNLDLVLDVAPGAVRNVEGDRVRLEQVLRNLVGNAVKFTRKGQVVLRVEVEMVRAGWVTVRFNVSDTGIGIPKDAQERIFDSFTQVDASTTRRFGGTGLGLPIARDLVAKMGGLMGLESEQGKGSNFWFTALFRIADRADISQIIGPDELRGRRALVIEKNKASGVAFERALRSIGLDSVVTDTPEEGFSAILTHESKGTPFHVYLVDAQLKDSEGRFVTSTIRDLGRAPAPLLLLAPAGARRMSGEWRPVDAVGVVTKPIRRKELIEGLQRALRGRESSPDFQPAPPPSGIFAPFDLKAKILVVEDEPVSRMTLVKTLERLGLRVTEAAHGRQAVDILSEEEFDIVFMDVQMPEMDGMEVTRIVRDSSSSVLQHDIPIVAVTAHAFTQHREACLEAGMNAYITKPIRSQELRGVLERFLGLALKASSSAPDHSAKIDISRDFEQRPLYVASVLLEKLGGEPAYVKEVLDLWFEDAPKRIDALLQASTSGDFIAVQQAAHTLKGGAANVGAERLRRIAEIIDFAARDQNLTPAKELGPTLLQELQAVKDHVQKRP